MTGALAPIWLVGCGAMGRAMLSRWQAAGIPDITVIDPAVPGARACRPSGIPAIVVLAVKPQVWKAAVAALDGIGSDSLVISIMAGISCAALAVELPDARIIRTMPNLASQLGQGVTALFEVGYDRADRIAAEALMSEVGVCLWLDRESDFDAVTAVSGSGPAYVFAFIEALTAAGVAAGLSPLLSEELAVRTVAGAAAMIVQPGASATVLREAVSSAGGTTLAALKVLQADLPALMRATVAAAKSRSRELSALA